MHMAPTTSLHILRGILTLPYCPCGLMALSLPTQSVAGIVAKRQVTPGLGAVLDVCQWGSSSLLVYSTQRGGVHAWDLRAKAVREIRVQKEIKREIRFGSEC